MGSMRVKRVVSMTLAVLMCVSLIPNIPNTAHAETVSSDDITYDKCTCRVELNNVTDKVMNIGTKLKHEFNVNDLGYSASVIRTSCPVHKDLGDKGVSLSYSLKPSAGVDYDSTTGVITADNLTAESTRLQLEVTAKYDSSKEPGCTVKFVGPSPLTDTTGGVRPDSEVVASYRLLTGMKVPKLPTEAGSRSVEGPIIWDYDFSKPITNSSGTLIIKGHREPWSDTKEDWRYTTIENNEPLYFWKNAIRDYWLNVTEIDANVPGSNITKESLSWEISNISDPDVRITMRNNNGDDRGVRVDASRKDNDKPFTFDIRCIMHGTQETSSAGINSSGTPGGADGSGATTSGEATTSGGGVNTTPSSIAVSGGEKVTIKLKTRYSKPKEPTWDNRYPYVDNGKPITVTKTVNIDLVRNVEAPSIRDVSYDSKNNKVSVTATPNGNKTTDIYIGGTKYGTIMFNRVGDEYAEKTQLINFVDSKSPLPVTAIKMARNSSDKTKATVTWNNNGDAPNVLEVYAQSGARTSNKLGIDAKSSITSNYIEVNPKDTVGTPETKKVAVNTYTFDIANLPWGSNIGIWTDDEAFNKSAISVLAVPPEVLYNTIVVQDSGEMDEGSVLTIDAKANDVHDSLYAVPLLATVEILDGKPGTAAIIESAGGGGDMSGKTVTYNGEDGYFGPVKLKYTYAKVRDDIPAAFGYIDINVKQRNQEPVAVDDDSSVTGGIDAEDGVPFEIPTSLLLKNDTDRETPGSLVVLDVRNCSAGKVSLVGDKIKVEPLEGFSGSLTFKYKITDGELESLVWATVTVPVKHVIKKPIAGETQIYMQMSDKSKVISLNVKNPSGIKYTLDPNIRLYRNGAILTDNIMSYKITYMVNENGLDIPYLTLVMKDSTRLKVDDVITVDYTIVSEKGSSSSKITVTMTKGDDPFDMEGYLYVHRRPTAVLAPIINKDYTGSYVANIVLGGNQESSYDIDHNKTDGVWSETKAFSWKGIRAWEWGAKTMDGAWVTKIFDEKDYAGSANAARNAGLAWAQATTNKIIADNPKQSVVMSLKVQDIDGPEDVGIWSDQRTLLLAAIPIKPVALFTLDKSTYTVPASGGLPIVINDLSYDSNGDKLDLWKWELFDTDGKSVLTKDYYGVGSFSSSELSNMVGNRIVSIVNVPGYSPKNTSFKLSLTVREYTADRLESDKYSVSFEVFKENRPPVITTKDGGQTGSPQTATLYEEDDAADGIRGDNWGTANNTTKVGVIDYRNLFTVTDDQDLGNLKVSWLFEGQRVKKRADYMEALSPYVQKAKSDLRYSPFEEPFRGTVTANGFKPGAYKLSVTVTDNPSGNSYAPGASQSAYWRTFANQKPFHLYVVPKLDMFMGTKFVSGGDTWINQEYRESDGKTYTELGLEQDDIAPTIGDVVTYTCKSNQFTTEIYGFNDVNGDGLITAGSETKLPFSMVSSAPDGTKFWELNYTIDDMEEAPGGVDFTNLKLTFVSGTNWGSDTEETIIRTKKRTLSIAVMPVKVYDFRVVDVTDPDISKSISRVIASLTQDKLSTNERADGLVVGRLAADRETTSTTGNSKAIRKGYSFYFKVSSKGLTKPKDEIRITPRFYASRIDANGKVKIGNELLGYVPDSKGVYKPYTYGVEISDEIKRMYPLYMEGNRLNSLGTHDDVRIPKELRAPHGTAQVWSGRYGIPADARFFPLGIGTGTTIDVENEFTGDILVTFEIKAYKDGKAKYNYVERGQWLKEREIMPPAVKAAYKIKEAEWKQANRFIGSVIVYDGGKSALDNYTSSPVWNE